MSGFEENFMENRNSQLKRIKKLQSTDDDLLMEQIINNLNVTPLGKVLKRIAALPEVRQKKVLDVRQRLSTDEYELNERLDIAMEKVLEDLKT